MIGVFVFSERRFFGCVDRIHLFPNEQAALDWQIEKLIAEGDVIATDDGWYFDGDLHGSKLDVLAAFQDSLGALEFFHEYAIETH